MCIHTHVKVSKKYLYQHLCVRTCINIYIYIFILLLDMTIYIYMRMWIYTHVKVSTKYYEYMCICAGVHIQYLLVYTYVYVYTYLYSCYVQVYTYVHLYYSSTRLFVYMYICNIYTANGPSRAGCPGQFGTALNYCTYACGVASVSSIDQIIGLFCKRALQKRLYSAKDTYNLNTPTNRSLPIVCSAGLCIYP